MASIQYTRRMAHNPEKAGEEISQEGAVHGSDTSIEAGHETKREDSEIDSLHSRSSSDTISPVEDVRQDALQSSKSNASSTRSRPLLIVPRAKRRGLLGRFAIIPEVENTYDYTNKTKWLITFIVALAAAAAPMGSSIFYRRHPSSIL